MKDLDRFLENKSHVIWDWNGTLLNDIEMCVGIISSLLIRYGYPGLTIDEYRQHFRFPVKQYYQDIGFDFKKIPFEIVSMEFVDAYNQQVHGCSLFHGTAALLDNLNERGLKHSVLSAAHEGDLRKLLNDHDLTGHFLNICGLGDHFAASKTARGLQLMQILDIPATEIVMIGDTDHDIEVATAMGIDILLFGDGHQCPGRLIKEHPMVLMRCPDGGSVRLYSRDVN